RRNAAFWRVGTNLTLLKRLLRDSGSSQLKYRLVLFIGICVVLNFLFNLMMFILTNQYLENIQPISSHFGFWTNTEFKGGVVNEVVKNNYKSANKNYWNCIESIAKELQLDYQDVDDVEDIILSDYELENAYLENQDKQFISSYCDLLIRYASTLVDQDGDTVVFVLNRALQIAKTFEKETNSRIGSYLLKNKALRALADLNKLKSGKFEDTEKALLEAIYLVEEAEFKTPPPAENFVVISEGELSSDTLTNSLLELCLLYTSTKEQKHMNLALSILLADLRSLERELRLLENERGGSTKHKSDLKNATDKRLNDLKFEMIPLVKLQVSEILWFKKSYNNAIEFAKDSALLSSFYSEDNFNSAKIAKIGFGNLAKMFDKVGDRDGAALCFDKAEKIEIPLNAFAKRTGDIRDVVLEHYFGAWGKFLF
ncbi:hypothetical protein CANARDRAFT_180607, partial [[Candida] arabinofermentans NRRL YB-2248]